MTGIATTSTIMISTSVTTTGREAAISGMKTGIAERHIDNWRARHLRRPPAGYEWRELDGQYVLANTDGVIFQVVIPH